MPYTQLQNLDFEDIKTALKEYLRAQDEFTDFDFEGSAWSNLLDVLAYNTYYTAFNTNMVVNELFLDSASLRDNVVAIAKQLGYRPKSKTAPRANITFNLNFNGSYPSTALLKKGSGFVTQFDNNLYQYVVVDDQRALINSSSTTLNVDVYEGTLITNFFTVSSAQRSQRFVLENQGIDVSTIRVKVYQSSNSTRYETYELSTNILDAAPTSKVFFVEEIEDERYEIFFGDGILGRKLENGEYIEVSYLTTSGPDSNGARVFTFNGVIEDENGSSSYVVTASNVVVNSIASGGENIESISKIKFNAPKTFGSQNRAVTAADFESIVRNVYPAVADIIVFGGEEADPPEYGKVKIAIKGRNVSTLSSVTRKQISDALKPYMVASVTPEVVNPSILYVELTSQIYYDSYKTTEGPNTIRNKVISSLENYISLSDTEKFNGKFRYSKFVGVIDEADRSINSNATSIMMRKDFYPSINSKFYYELCYQNEFDKDCDGPTLSSTGFVVSQYPNYTVYLEDRDGKIVLYRLDDLTGDKILVNEYVGDINYVKGETMLYDLTILKGSFFDNRIEVRVKPKKNDISASREVYLDVDIQNSKFTAYKE
jgi:hypothetical protein